MVTAEDIDDMDFDLPAGPTASTSSRMAAADSSSADRRTWTVVYPIYLDSKASKQHRRVSKDLAVPWPLARLMAVECARLGLKTHLEQGKCHPSDWANPGRLRVQLERNNRPVNPAVKNKQMLLEKIARGHPRLDPSKPIYERLPENSPLFARGLIEEAIANPQSMTPPGMEGFMSNMAQQQPAPQDAQASIKGKESTAGGGGKQKKKVIHVRR